MNSEELIPVANILPLMFFVGIKISEGNIVFMETGTQIYE